MTKKDDDDNDRASMPDEENPEWTEADFKRARPALEVIEEIYGKNAADSIRKRGQPKKENPKVNQTLRLDPDVIESYKDTGAGWQARMNDVLREHMPNRQK